MTMSQKDDVERAKSQGKEESERLNKTNLEKTKEVAEERAKRLGK